MRIQANFGGILLPRYLSSELLKWTQSARGFGAWLYISGITGDIVEFTTPVGLKIG
jgi:hypothetical protein